MAPLLEQNRERIIELCRTYGITRLDVFGSAARGDDFDPATSDVDFFYDLDVDQPRVADRYFEFLFALEALLKTRVELVSERDVRNPYFMPVANQARTTLYAA